jgi:hypothetical protein
MTSRADIPAPSSESRPLSWRDRLQIRRCLGGTPLSCGCLLGHYETYAGRLLVIVDHHAASCTDPRHVRDHVIEPADAKGHIAVPVR